MSPDEIQALLDLQELDVKLLEYEKHQKALPGLLEAIAAPLSAAREGRERVEAELALARNQHKQVELELAVNNEQFKRLQTRQMGVRNQVEYEAIQHEMESLKDRADDLEEAGLNWIERSEAAGARMPEVTEVLEAAEKVATEAREQLDAKTAELKRIHDEASQLTSPLVERVPAQTYSYYKRLRRAGKVPFVAVVRLGACAGCGFRHPPQKLQEIKLSRRMATCEQCGRIQVWKELEDDSIGF